MNSDVAFEVDEIVDEHATSVIVRGRARTLAAPPRGSSSGSRCGRGSTTPKSIVVEIEVDEITGRRFDLSRPWLHARVEPA